MRRFPPPPGCEFVVIAEVAGKEAKVITIHLYMTMSNRLMTMKDSILDDPKVGFAVGTSVALPAD